MTPHAERMEVRRTQRPRERDIGEGHGTLYRSVQRKRRPATCVSRPNVSDARGYELDSDRARSPQPRTGGNSLYHSETERRDAYPECLHIYNHHRNAKECPESSGSGHSRL